MKRLFGLILVYMLSLSFVGCSASKQPIINTDTDTGATASDNTSEETRYSEGLSFFKKADGTYCVNGVGTCSDTDIVIPSVYQNQTVTEIAESAFAFTDNIRSVVIPESIISINPNAFYLCADLESIFFEDKQGWIAKELDTLVTGIEISVDDAVQAAILLKDTYRAYYLRKNKK